MNTTTTGERRRRQRVGGGYDDGPAPSTAAAAAADAISMLEAPGEQSVVLVGRGGSSAAITSGSGSSDLEGILNAVGVDIPSTPPAPPATTTARQPGHGRQQRLGPSGDGGGRGKGGVGAAATATTTLEEALRAAAAEEEQQKVCVGLGGVGIVKGAGVECKPESANRPTKPNQMTQILLMAPYLEAAARHTMHAGGGSSGGGGGSSSSTPTTQPQQQGSRGRGGAFVWVCCGWVGFFTNPFLPNKPTRTHIQMQARPPPPSSPAAAEAAAARIATTTAAARRSSRRCTSARGRSLLRWPSAWRCRTRYANMLRGAGRFGAVLGTNIYPTPTKLIYYLYVHDVNHPKNTKTNSG